MKLSETVSLQQVLEAHAELVGEYRSGKITWYDILRDERRADFSGANLNGASLNGANLNGASLNRASLNGASLIGASLIGASLIGANLNGANLNGASLNRASLNGASLIGANLNRANLDGASLIGASLNRASLNGASLNRANLDGANLPFEVPIVKDLDKKILDTVEGENTIGTLEMSSWHTCKTTHCRAGWAITFAGPEGRMMEKILGASVAGGLIYAVSRPGKPIPDFMASNADALASIKADALEAANA